MDKLVSVHISDIHFGSIPIADINKELNNHFINYLFNNKIQLLVIHGDLFDTKTSLTSPVSVATIKFINELCKYTRKNKIEFRLINGTKSHDYNQLDNFKHLEKQYTNFRIFDRVTEESLFGLNYLYVPEEYVNDQEEYYREFKEKEYDYMFGHGTWDVAAFQSQIEESEKPIKTAPVFIYNEWKDVVKQRIIFGHIHVFTEYKKLVYPGSFTRWIFSEEKPKGFIVNTHDFKTSKSKIEFIENPDAKQFNTIKIQENAKLEDIINEATNLDESVKFRLDFSDANLSLDEIAIIKQALNQTENIKIVNTSNLIKDFIEETNEEEKAYDFLKSNSLVNNIQKFIEVKFGEILTEDQIKEAILETTYD